jgi:hypothetical protein
MSYQVVGGPGARRRPGVVTAAVGLLYGSAALIAILGALGTVNSFLNPDVMSSALPSNLQVPGGFFQGVAIAIAVIYGLFAVGMLVLAVQVGKGRNPARIVAWVAAGIFALCCGCSQLLAAVGQAVPNSLNAEPNTFRATVDEPTWFTASSTVVVIVLVLSLLAVIVAMAVPAANDFFRREQEIPQPFDWPAVYSGAYPYPQPPSVPQYPYQPVPPAPVDQSRPDPQPYGPPPVPPVPGNAAPPSDEPPAAAPPTGSEPS